jgi:hypothetical protein
MFFLDKNGQLFRIVCTKTQHNLRAYPQVKTTYAEL